MKHSPKRLLALALLLLLFISNKIISNHYQPILVALGCEKNAKNKRSSKFADRAAARSRQIWHILSSSTLPFVVAYWWFLKRRRRRHYGPVSNGPVVVGEMTERMLTHSLASSLLRRQSTNVMLLFCTKSKLIQARLSHLATLAACLEHQDGRGTAPRAGENSNILVLFGFQVYLCECEIDFNTMCVRCHRGLCLHTIG